jgi:DNA-binding beta-propeller fold protein YncE
MRIHKLSAFLAALSALVSVIIAFAGPQKGGYNLVKKIPLGAASGGGEYFDYLLADSAARRVYVSHGTEFLVLDADSYARVGAIASLKRCHGVALVPELGKGFITDGGAAKVVIFDLKSLKVTGEIKTEEDADSIIYDPASKRIFSFNGDPKSATVIDPAAGTVVKTLALGGGPEFAVADGQGSVYNNIEDKNEVAVIDSRALTIKSRWPVAPAGAPTALAMDTRHRRLFSSGRNPQMMVVMDADSGKVIQSFPITAGADANVFDPESGLIFVSTREGLIHIFHEDSPDKYSVFQTVTTEFGAKTMTQDAKTGRLFLSTADFAPASAPDAGRPARRSPIPGTFRLLVYGR